MATTIRSTKFFYPPRPGSGAQTFSDNIVGLQTVQGGGLTQGNFEFTTGITEKVNRKFNVGAFSEPMTLDSMNIEDLAESRRIMATQFRVYPNYDVSQVLNFSMYGALSKRFSVSVLKIINYFPASIDCCLTRVHLLLVQLPTIYHMIQLKMKHVSKLMLIDLIILLILIILSVHQRI